MRFSQLAEQFVQTLEKQGATVLVQGDMNARPARFRVITSDRKVDCLLYLWTITPGGGPGGERPAHERRIQITNPNTDGGFPLLPGTRTLIGGFNEETGAWAFWDARFHSRFSPRSPSLQVHLQTLERAAHRGIDTQSRPVRDGNQEVVAAISEDSLLWFVEHGETLHNVGDDAPEVADLVNATPEEEDEFVESSSTGVEVARRVELVATLRRYRDARFRPVVLQAYRYRCAVCGTALKLVEAAHIVPVSDPRSNDDVTNGIALCRLHHGAYDNGLMGIQSNYSIVLNPEAIRRLDDANLKDGLDVFQQVLPGSIRLPASLEVQPRPDNLRIGLAVRLFPNALIA